MEKNNATCSICGKPYYLCMACKDTMKLQPWKAFTDTANCYKVFQVVRGFSTDVYTKDEAKEKLKNIDLSGLDFFRPHIRDIIKDILKEDKKVVKPIVEPVVEPKVDMTVEDITEAVANVEKPVYSRKRNLKIEADTE